jgi:hypothetical protein
MRSKALVTAALAAFGCSCGQSHEQAPPPGGDGGAGGSSALDGGAMDASQSTDGSPTGSHDAGHDAGAAEDAAHVDASSSNSGGPQDGGPGSGSAVVVNVTNGCPFDLWIQATAMEGTLQPDNVRLTQGTSQSYDAPLTWTSGRVYGYFQAPDANGTPQGQNDKVEANFYVQGGSEYVNSDITYVDWVALPSQIETLGTGSDCTTIGCQAPYASLLTGCPAALLSSNACTSAGYHCLTTTDANDPYCHALDAQIGACASEYPDCAGAAGATTTEVYSCSGSFFGGSAEYCAALNRNVLSAPGAATPASDFYQTPPFNTYAQWVHQKCPGIYAFPYDDFGSTNQSSDHTCTGATRMNVTFCPKG